MKLLLKKLFQNTVFCIATLFFTASLSPAQDLSYEKGADAYAKKDYRTAVKYLSEYVGKKPNANAHAYYLLGYAYYKLNNHPESMRAFKEAYNLDPAVSLSPGKQ
jgi:tetratricopeptide (TPR) repeat protein